LTEKKIAIIGLGYVGLPLAIEFGKKYFVMGFDINQSAQEVLSAVLALCLLQFLWKTCSKPPT
jgi:UDP-N-acetyl-D-mannosaminuronate dehydrogenase